MQQMSKKIEIKKLNCKNLKTRRTQVAILISHVEKSESCLLY